MLQLPEERGSRPTAGAAQRAQRAQLWGGLALLAAAAVATIWLWLGRRRTWWAPAIGTGSVVLLTIGTTIAMRAATQTL